MNFYEAQKITSLASSQNFLEGTHWPVKVKPYFFIGLGFCAAIAYLGILMVKARTAEAFFAGQLLLGYTFFVTTFQLSRLVSALFYRSSYTSILSAPSDSDYLEYLPKISFVIPCKNEEKVIAQTVSACFAAHYPADLTEVIVINDGSTDGTGNVLHALKRSYPKLEVITWRKNRGKRHGMAEGFKRASGDIIIQLDSDSYIDPASVREMVKPFANREIGALSAHTDPSNADKNFVTKMQAAYYFMSFRILKAAESTYQSVMCCSGCSSAYRRDAVMPIIDEWLAESFLGKPITWGDDRALTNWVLKRGYRTIYSGDVQAYTVVPETLRQFIKQQIRWKKGWFVNSIIASKFMLKRNTFVALTYFFPLILVTVATPIVAFKALVIGAFFGGLGAIVWYIAGVSLMASLILIFYRWVAPDNQYWLYLWIWACINMIVLSFLLYYALFTIQDRRWGTR